MRPLPLNQFRGSSFPFWDGDLFTGGLSGQSLRRLRIRNGRVVLQECMLFDLNERLRTVQVGPDNLIYLLTDAYGQGRVLRLRPGTPPAGDHIAKPLFEVSSENDRGWKDAPNPYKDAFGAQWEAVKDYRYDPVRANRHFQQFCAGCHTFQQFNAGDIGPDLNGINGRRSGQLKGFEYSAAFSAPDNQLVWNYLTLYTFLSQPRSVFPDTRMSIPPLPMLAVSDIVNLLTDGEMSEVYGKKD